MSQGSRGIVNRGLTRHVIAVASLDNESFLLYGQLNPAISGTGVLIRRVTQRVLIPQLFLNLAIDIFHGLLLGPFEESSPGFLGEPLHDLLAIRPILHGRPSHPAAPSHATAAESTHGLTALLVCEKN